MVLIVFPFIDILSLVIGIVVIGFLFIFGLGGFTCVVVFLTVELYDCTVGVFLGLD